MARVLEAVLTLALAWCAFAAGPDGASGYVETGECENLGQVCSYSYAARQDFLNEGEQTMSVNATVEITCSSSGTYNSSDAKLYCMSVKNPRIMGSLFENSTEEEIRAIQQSLNQQLENWFCFVQSTSGKVPAVFHSTSEPDHVVSLKKAIAAAFQANFAGTEEEEETDPQSRHKSHYTYPSGSEDGVLRMKRSVRRGDVSQYSIDAPAEDIDTSKDEEVEYESGKLKRSSGNATFHLLNDSLNEVESDFSLTQAFSASGSYSLELQECNNINSYAYRVQKKKVMSEMRKSKEEDLTATVDKKKEGFEQMKMLRERLPSGSALNALQRYEEYGEKLVSIIQRLIELESQYGALALYVPVIDDIMTYITTMPATDADRKVREAVIMILIDEGSLRSQMALLSAYDNALDSTEANTILMHISLMEKVRVGFVIGMEERLDREIGDLNLARQLILVFASLATKGSDEVEDRVMNYLAALVTAETSAQNTSDVNDIILLVHALGNTGSKLSIAPIFSILDSSVSRADYNTIKLAVIESLTKVTDDPMVLSRLEEIVSDSDDSSDCVATVIETLENGLEYVKKIGLETDEYLTMVRSHPLIYSLIETVASGNDSDLVLAMEHYLSILPGTEDHYNVLYSLTGSLRQRRGTYWAEANSDYDLVQGLSERQSDVSTFVRHSSYINSKRVGIDEANIKIAYGYFAGTNYHCDNAKAYARTRVVGTLLSHTSTFADVKVDIRATTTSASITAYAKVGSNYLLQHSASGTLSNHCFPYNRNLASYTTRLFRLSFSLFVYVAYLTLSVDVDAHFNMGLTTNMCIGRTGLEATGAIATITPTVGVTVTGGVSANLLYLVRGGIDVSVTLNYRLEPAVSVQGCTARCSISTRLLLGVFDSYPDSGVNLYAWWQHQSAGFCGSGWFRYPCLKWSRKHTWDALSATWSLGRQSRRAIYEYCTGNFDPMCSSAALDSSIFTCN